MRSSRTIALVAGLALWSAHASAHAFLSTASPAVGSTVSQAPSQVVIDFTEGVEPRFSTITVQNAQGTRIETGKPHLVGGDTHLAVDLKPLPPGTYTVAWHATATDTHKTQGTFQLTVGSK
jgi:methionine-rich copper-binding protein CopC